ncbi:MAG TPA: BBP7 family outer membrane beta-barrel protein [Gemmataceae bacterium]|nr:BBP7 family outer membrane beta-barrel protein [Gemmataceae bacterium]
MKHSLFFVLTALFAGANALLAQPPLVAPPANFTQPNGSAEPAIMMENAAPYAGVYQPAPPADSSRIWGRAEDLLWWIKGSPLPVPLVITGSDNANPAPVLGQTGTVVLLGGQGLENPVRSGGRFTVGYWFDDDHQLGTEVRYFFLGSRTVSASVHSSGQPGSELLALPFFDVTAPAESSTFLALPGAFEGTAVLASRSELQGWEWNALTRLAGNDTWNIELLGGFRYLNLNEQLSFATSSPNILPPADVFRTLDEFDTSNHFYGGQIGAEAEFRRGRWYAELVGKVALGSMIEVVNVHGQLVTNDLNAEGTLQTFPGGYLAQPTNSGRQRAAHFAVLPEAGLNVGCQVTPRLRLLVGYTFLYASNVVRPGDQIDRGINPTQAPAITGLPTTAVIGPQRPAPLFRTSDFWAQGLNFGLEFRF